MLSKSVSAAIESAKPAAKILGLNLEYSGESKGPRIAGDAAALERSFSLVLGALLILSAKGSSLEVREGGGNGTAVRFKLTKSVERAGKVVEQASKPPEALGGGVKSLEDVSALILAAKQIIENHKGTFSITGSKSGVTVECSLSAAHSGKS